MMINFNQLVDRLTEMAVSAVHKTSQLSNASPTVPARTDSSFRDYKMMTTAAGIKNITKNFAKAVNQDIVLVVIDQRLYVNRPTDLDDLPDETKLAINKLSTPNNIVLVCYAHRGQELLTPWMLGHRWGHNMMNDVDSGAYGSLVSLVGKYIVKNRIHLIDLLVDKYHQYAGPCTRAMHWDHEVKLGDSKCEVQAQKFKVMCNSIVDAYGEVSEILAQRKQIYEIDVVDKFLDFSGESFYEIPYELRIENLLFRPSINNNTDFRGEMFNNVFAYYVKFGKMPIQNLHGSDNANLEQGIVKIISNWIDDQKGGVHDIGIS